MSCKYEPTFFNENGLRDRLPVHFEKYLREFVEMNGWEILPSKSEYEAFRVIIEKKVNIVYYSQKGKKLSDRRGTDDFLDRFREYVESFKDGFPQLYQGHADSIYNLK